MPPQRSGGALAGCHNCSKRRIRCDRATPECEKCLRKGFSCPGYGKRYRFNDGIASRGRQAGRSLPSGYEIDNLGRQVSHSLPPLVWVGAQNNNTASALIPILDDVEDVNRVIKGSPSRIHELLNINDDGEDWTSPVSSTALVNRRRSAVCDSMALRGGFTLAPSIEILDARSRELFAHFSSKIASTMVVLDGKFNGYRDILLPLACEDDLVKAAVMVASMYHLSIHQPELRRQADADHCAIIRRLRCDAERSTNKSNVLSMSAWATIVTLLTVETVSGGTNLPYLFKMLRYVADANSCVKQASVLQTFLIEQTKMITLFAEPLLGETPNSITIAHHPDQYLDFLSNMLLFHPTHSGTISILESAIRQAYNIYFHASFCSSTPELIDSATDAFIPIALEALRNTCLQIQPDTPGHHTLVWVYFIGAAESRDPTQRGFFVYRLRSIFERTRFNNIPVAIAALENIWARQSDLKWKWTKVLPKAMPLFII